LDDEWRPDRSNILLQLGGKADGTREMTVNLTGVLTRDMVFKLLNLIDELVADQFETYLCVVGPPNVLGRRVLLNPVIEPALRRRDSAEAMAILNGAIEHCIKEIVEGTNDKTAKSSSFQ
jgi:hypothetical protein